MQWHSTRNPVCPGCCAKPRSDKALGVVTRRKYTSYLRQQGARGNISVMKCRLFHLTATFSFLSLLILNANATSSVKPIRDFKEPTHESQWVAENDGVMGGVSTGHATIDSGHLHFAGKISLENNGGFAQIYSSTEDLDVSEYSAIRLRIKGDGRVYQFRLTTDERYRGSRIAYKSEFRSTANQWTEVSIPLSTFSPTYRGRALSGPPLDKTSIKRIGLLLSDGQPGAFSLLVDWIGLE